ncbi:MAG: hypothetical protein QOJ19_1935 [Acidimicrobiia bacterium]|jgi:uncharacterized HhH-GPD family protein|nr:hypothetical protein [Acidimicrobiia bacterium]
MAAGSFPVTGNALADELISTNPFALLVGMLLDQQVPLEWAFGSPLRLRERLGGKLSPQVVAAMSPDEVEKLFRTKPALHRYPGSMAKRTHDLAVELIARYDGRAENLWDTASTGQELLDRLRALPGYGDEKAKILVAVLAKRFAVRPPGWEAACAPFSDDEPRSAADIDSPEAFERVKAWKRTMRQQGKSKQD